MLHGHTRGGGLNIQVKVQYVDLYTYILFPTSTILLLWVGRFGRPPTQSVSRLFDELGMSLGDVDEFHNKKNALIALWDCDNIYQYQVIILLLYNQREEEMLLAAVLFYIVHSLMAIF